MLQNRQIIGVALIVFLTGCGEKKLSSTNVSVQPVKGKVLVGDRPLPGGFLNLYLISNNDKYGEASAVAEVQPDGTFEPKQVGDKNGLVEGKWKVVIQPNYSKDGKSFPLNIQAKYTQEDTTDLTFEVTSGDNTPTLTIR